MSKTVVYLAGAMAGLTIDEMAGWRIRAKEGLISRIACL
jgi:hypothetical protein